MDVLVFINYVSLGTYYYFKNFIYFWLHWVFTAVCKLSLVVVSAGYSLVALSGFLIAVSSVADLAIKGAQTSVVVALPLPCSVACGIFSHQRSNPRLLTNRHVINHWTREVRCQ